MATNCQVISRSEVEQIVPKVVAQAQQIVISTPEEYEMTGSFLQLIARRKKEVEATFDPIIQKAHEAHKEALAQKAKFMNPLTEAERTVKGKMVAFSTEQERLRKQEEARLAKEAADRRADEALTEAAQLEAQGEKVLADIVLQHAADCELQPAPVIVQSSVPKTAGIATTKVWKFEVTDERVLPREFLQVNTTAISAVVRAQKSMAKIPGVRVWCEDSVKVTGR